MEWLAGQAAKTARQPSALTAMPQAELQGQGLTTAVKGRTSRLLHGSHCANGHDHRRRVNSSRKLPEQEQEGWRK